MEQMDSALLAHGSAVSMPYWDWTQPISKLPALFHDATYFNSRTSTEDPNPFFRSVEREGRRELGKLQALVYDILPLTTTVFSYAIGPRKLSANEQFFVGAQTVVSLLQTIQIKQGVSFIAANKVYTSTNKTTIA